MIIGIDAHTVGQKHTGNETYALNLIRCLQREDLAGSYRIYLTRNGLVSGEIDANGNATLVKVPESSWSRFAVALPLDIARHPIDLLHVQYVAPPGVRARLVTTIHDISYIHLPQQIGVLARMRVERLFPATARRSDQIITGSAATKRDLIEHFRIEDEKILVIPYGVSDAFRRLADQSEVDAVLQSRGLERGYILYVGALQPRKNIARLLQAYDLLKQAERVPEKLVILGKKAWLYQDVLDTHRSLSSKDDVVFLDYVPEAELPHIYNGAKVFVYPSLYEGFGLPPLEAMACGVPVAVSAAPAMPEVVGNAGVYFDPRSVESIAEGMHRLLRDGTMREDLANRGMSRAAQYTWRRTAVGTLAVYRDVLSR